MRQGESFPVGKVDTIRMYPMTFDEFLLAKGKTLLADLLRKNEWETLQGLHSTLVQMLREYYRI